MKQYLWIGIVVLLVSAHASDNPFDLKENFGKLDKEQEVLLSELKRLAELKEAAEEDAAVQEAMVDEKKEVVIATPVIKESENKITESLDTVIEEVSNASSSQLNTMRQNTLAESDESEESFNAKISNSENIKVTELGKEAQEKEALLAAVKQKEAELQQLRAEELRQIEAKKDAERREVEAYEKQRAEKLARQKAEEASALEKEALTQNAIISKQLVQEEVKKEDLKKVIVEKSQKLMPKKEEITEAKQREEDKKTSIVDINVTREKIEEKVAADKAYEDAIKEMNEES